MIGRLSGNLILIEGNLLLLDVAGVGYEVEVSAGVLANSPQTGVQLTLFTHFVVREEAQLLFGFADQRERDLFRAYIRINGVGPKMALALISSISPAALASAQQQLSTAMEGGVDGSSSSGIGTTAPRKRLTL